MEFNPWFQFVLAGLATWRLTHLVALEDGPANVLVRLRGWLGRSFFGTLLDCFQCLSLWFAALLALVVSTRPLEWSLVWLALSGTACLLERLTQPPVVIQPLSTLQGEPSHGMLQPKSSGAQASPGSHESSHTEG